MHNLHCNTTQPVLANLLLAPTIKTSDLGNQPGPSSFRLLASSGFPSAAPSVQAIQTQSPSPEKDVNMEITNSSSVCLSDTVLQWELSSVLPTRGRMAYRTWRN